MSGPLYLWVLIFQQSSARQRGWDIFQNGVYCSLTPQGSVPAIQRCPLSNYCRHFLKPHFPGLLGLSLLLPAVKVSASRCNISLGAFSFNRSDPTGPVPQLMLMRSVPPPSFHPFYVIALPLTQDTREITRASGLARCGNPGLTERALRAMLEELSPSSQFKWPGEVWLIPIMSCFSTSLLEGNVSWPEMQWFGLGGQLRVIHQWTDATWGKTAPGSDISLPILYLSDFGQDIWANGNCFIVWKMGIKTPSSAYLKGLQGESQ